jgi:hypothetical protein
MHSPPVCRQTPREYRLVRGPLPREAQNPRDRAHVDGPARLHRKHVRNFYLRPRRDHSRLFCVARRKRPLFPVSVRAMVLYCHSVNFKSNATRGILSSCLISHSLMSGLSFLISHLSSLISLLSSPISHLSSLISHLSSLISHLSSSTSNLTHSSSSEIVQGEIKRLMNDNILINSESAGKFPFTVCLEIAEPARQRYLCSANNLRSLSNDCAFALILLCIRFAFAQQSRYDYCAFALILLGLRLAFAQQSLYNDCAVALLLLC